MNQSAALSKARDAFLSRLLPLLERLPETAGRRVFAAAEKSRDFAEHQFLLRVFQQLRRRADALAAELPRELGELLERGFETAYGTYRPSVHEVAKGTRLQLVDTAAIEDDVMLKRLVALTHDAAGGEIADLNVRVANLFGQQNVSERENPFRPYLVFRCLPLAGGAAGIEPAYIPAVTEQLGQALIPDLQNVYRALNGMLDAYGIPAEIRYADVVSSVSGRPTAGAAMATSKDRAEDRAEDAVDQAMPAASGDRILSPGQRLQQLIARWAGEFSGRPAAPRVDAAPAGGPARPATGGLRRFFSGDNAPAPEGDGLTGYVADHARRLAEVQASPEAMPNLIFERRAELGAHASNLSELITIDVVGMLFEYILRDGNVPAEVRAQIARLQFTLLKVALADPSVMGERTHPARELINRIGSVALALSGNASATLQFTAAVRTVVEALLAADDAGRETIARELARFDEALQQVMRSVAPQMPLSIDTLVEAERRSIALDRVTRGLRDAIGGLQVPLAVQELLLGPWAQVIETVERPGIGDAAEPPDAAHYRALAPLLVWSVLPKTDEPARRQLVGAIGGLLHRLKEGFALVDLPAEARERQAQMLLDLHRMLIRYNGPAFDAIRLDAVEARFKDFLAAAAEDDDAAASASGQALHPAIVREMTGAAARAGGRAEGAMTAMPESVDDMAELDAGASQPVDIDQAMQDMVAQRLHAGVRIEIRLGGTVRSAILTWRGRRVANLLLDDADGPKPVSLSLRLFRIMLAGGRARFTETAPLFERAIESVLADADVPGETAPQGEPVPA